MNTATDEPSPADDAALRVEESTALSTVDRYYLAWTDYQSKHSEEPRDKQLSGYLAAMGMNGRAGKPVSPSTLRRYFVQFRLYNVWVEQRLSNDSPSSDVIAQRCAVLGVTAAHNQPITSGYIDEQSEDFERRWQALARHYDGAQQ